MSKLIVIIGITGIQGSSVAATFLETPGWKIRGITRDPSKAAAVALSEKGIEVVKADLNDVDSLKAAFLGATAIFSVTDFWAPIFQPTAASNAEIEKRGVPPNRYAYDLEIEQGMNAAIAASDPAVLKTLTHFVYSALADATKWSKGKYKMNLHFESKGKVVERIQEELPQLAERLSTVQIGMYTTNWKINPAMGPMKREDGKFVFRVVDGEQGLSKVPYVVTRKDTGRFVKGLIENPPGKNMLGVTHSMTQAEYLDLWTKTLNVPNGGIEAITMEQFISKMPPFLHEEMHDTFMFGREFGWTGGDESVVLPEELGVETSVQGLVDYFKEEDWSTVLSQ
ncbi:hypothetical protein MMC25_001528 [Agyrium rufum]|nr:hypothetical protein [Agyrium rufum]